MFIIISDLRLPSLILYMSVCWKCVTQTHPVHLRRSQISFRDTSHSLEFSPHQRKAFKIQSVLFEKLVFHGWQFFFIKTNDADWTNNAPGYQLYPASVPRYTFSSSDWNGTQALCRNHWKNACWWSGTSSKTVARQTHLRFVSWVDCRHRNVFQPARAARGPDGPARWER